MFDIGGLMESIGDAIKEAILNMIGTLLYYITIALMWIIQILQQLFNVFSGVDKVKYGNDYQYLTTVFLNNQGVKNVYWGMALIGMLFVFVFGIIAVIRKVFDLSDKHANQSLGSILGSMFKAIFTMVIIGFCMNMILDLTNAVISRIGYIFDNADSLHVEREIEFTSEQYAAMARIYQTIGNYSLNPSYNNRYNLNKCYNEIRSDLDWLADEGVFQYTYVTYDEANYEIDTWQSVLQELYIASNTERDLSMDVYHEAVSEQLLHIMSILRTNASFPALERYENPYTVTEGVGLDRIIFLSGTMSAANNSKFNEKPYMTDAVRGAFFVGEKSIYDLDEVSSAFRVALGGIKYIMIWLVAYYTIRNLLRCIFSCIMRIFNMVSLYIIAPLTAASIPLDDGEKFKQWVTSMTVQCLGVLGVIIPMRLVILFTPIILGEKLVLFPNSTILNFIGKVLMIVGAMEAVEGFGQTVTGILANNASMAALNAGNSANALGDKAFGMMKGAAGGAAGLVSDVTGLSTLGNAVGGALGGGLAKAGKAMKEHGGLVGALVHAARGGKSDAAGGGGGGDGGKDDGKGDGKGGDGDGGSGGGPQNLNESTGGESDAGSGPLGENLDTNNGSTGGADPQNLNESTGGAADQSKKDGGSGGGGTPPTGGGGGTPPTGGGGGTPPTGGGGGGGAKIDKKTFDGLFGAGAYEKTHGGGGSTPQKTNAGASGGDKKGGPGAGGSGGAAPKKNPPPIPPRPGSGAPKFSQAQFDGFFGAGAYQRTYGGGGNNTPPPNNPGGSGSGSGSVNNTPEQNASRIDNLFGAGTYQRMYGGGGNNTPPPNDPGSSGGNNTTSYSQQTFDGLFGQGAYQSYTSSPRKTPPPGTSASQRLNDKLNK